MRMVLKTWLVFDDDFDDGDDEDVDEQDCDKPAGVKAGFCKVYLYFPCLALALATCRLDGNASI